MKVGPWSCLLAKITVSEMRHFGRDCDEIFKRRSHVASSVPPEDKFVKVALKVRLSDPVIGAEGPSLEVGEDAVDPGKGDMGCHRAYDMRLVIVVFEGLVRGEAVADDGRASFYGVGDEAADPGAREIGEWRKADAARKTFGRKFDRADDVDFADRASSLAAGNRVVLRPVRDVAFVDLDEGGEQRAVRIDHGAAEFLKHEPGGLVGAKSELGLQL